MGIAIGLREDSSVVIAALVVLAVVTVLARRAIGNPVLMRLRALLPAWRFFDRPTLPPYLLLRWSGPGGTVGPWSPIEPGPRGIASWAFAPQANLHLAYCAVIEQLVAELGELDLAEPTGPDVAETDPAIVGRVSYALVSRIALEFVPADVRGSGAVFQWKLVVPGDASDDADSLVSLELAA